MKKILFLLFFGLILVSATPVASAQISTSSGQNKTVDYALPYPGLLSDSPLYFVKALRDRIVEIFIADPLKKADFYLLAADKRLAEGSLLFDKGSSKYSLAESTISKGENYFEKGIGQLQLAQKQNLPVNSLIQKYHLSSGKHEEVIKGLINRSGGNIRNGLTYSQERVAKFEKMLIKFNPQK